MARCPYLDYKDAIWTSDCKFICKVTGQQFDFDSSQVKYTCKVDYGEEYKKCPAYQSK